MTSNSKLNKDKNQVTITPPSSLEIGKYQVFFDIETSRTINLNSSLRIVDKLKVTSLSYEVSTKKSFPSKLKESIDYSNKIQKEIEV